MVSVVLALCLVSCVTVKIGGKLNMQEAILGLETQYEARMLVKSYEVGLNIFSLKKPDMQLFEP
jgi:hypothetical protein